MSPMQKGNPGDSSQRRLSRVRPTRVQTKVVRVQTKVVRVQTKVVRVQTKVVRVQTKVVRVQTKVVRVQTKVVRVRVSKVRTDEKGFILITILLVIAVLFPLILAFNAKVQLNLIQAENFRNSVQALRIARSGVAGAIGILKADDATYDAKTDKWAAAFPSMALGDGILNVVVTDEDGKLPINNLVAPVKTTQATGGTTPAGTTTQTTGGTTPTGTTTQAVAGPTPAGTTTQATGGTTPASTTTQATGGTTPTGTTTLTAGNATYQLNKDLDTRLRSLITQLGGRPEIVDALIDGSTLTTTRQGLRAPRTTIISNGGIAARTVLWILWTSSFSSRGSIRNC